MSLELIAIEQASLAMLGVPAQVRKRRLKWAVDREIRRIEESRKKLELLRKKGVRIVFDAKIEGRS
jgi:hypothetical protein